jgi:hypothetical protein
MNDESINLMELHPELFCWASDPTGWVACDRVKHHLGPHSWEPWGDERP